MKGEKNLPKVFLPLKWQGSKIYLTQYTKNMLVINFKNKLWNTKGVSNKLGF